MIPWYWAIIALFAGVFIGWFFCALCFASDAQDEGGEHR